MTENIRHSSASNEHYTPPEIVEAARFTLGHIDLDPASCAKANAVVRASRWYGLVDNGYQQDFEGNVFLNPPGGWCDVYGRPVIKKSKDKAACTLTGECGLAPGHTHTGTESSQKLWWQRLAQAWAEGYVHNAVFVCFSIELLQSTQVDPKGPLPLEFPICYPARRVPYIGEDGKPQGSPPHASCIICLTNRPDVLKRFIDHFSTFGHIVVPRA
jgi:hypothetical protein